METDVKSTMAPVIKSAMMINVQDPTTTNVKYALFIASRRPVGNVNVLVAGVDRLVRSTLVSARCAVRSVTALRAQSARDVLKTHILTYIKNVSVTRSGLDQIVMCMSGTVVRCVIDTVSGLDLIIVISALKMRILT